MVLGTIAIICISIETPPSVIERDETTRLIGVAAALGALVCWTAFAVANTRWLARVKHISGHDWNLLGGVVIPEAGTVSVGGVDIAALPAARRDAFRADRVGFIFQMFNLVPYLSLLDNAALPCRFSAARRERAEASGGSVETEAARLLSRMGLDIAALGGRPVTELSVGQQQRVAAARALIGAPGLVVADEPTSALDADVRRIFLDLLFAEVAAAGSTLLFVSHDAALEAAFDRVVTLSDVNRATGGAP